MGLGQRIASIFRHRELEQNIADERPFHFEQRERANRERGMTAEEAQTAARRSFGNVTLARERTADSDLVQSADSVLRDSRLALRLLRKSPAFTVTALLTLALGIGANTAVFTLMKLIVLDALPVKQPDRLVVLHDSGPPFSSYGSRMGNSMSSAFSYPLYRDIDSATSKVFTGVLARAHKDASPLSR